MPENSSNCRIAGPIAVASYPDLLHRRDAFDLTGITLGGGVLRQAQAVLLRVRRCAHERRSERPGRAGLGVRSGRDRVQRGRGQRDRVQVTLEAEAMVAGSTVAPPADAKAGIEGDRCEGNHCGSRPFAEHVHLPVDTDRRGERRRATGRAHRVRYSLRAGEMPWPRVKGRSPGSISGANPAHRDAWAAHAVSRAFEGAPVPVRLQADGRSRGPGVRAARPGGPAGGPASRPATTSRQATLPTTFSTRLSPRPGRGRRHRRLAWHGLQPLPRRRRDGARRRPRRHRFLARQIGRGGGRRGVIRGSGRGRS